MKANGTARANLARSMKVEDFLDYVLECIEEELKEWNYRAEIIPSWDQDKENCAVIFQVDKAIFSLRLNRAVIQKCQKKAAFALDRLLWKKLKEEGIELQENRYIEAVFI